MSQPSDTLCIEVMYLCVSTHRDKYFDLDSFRCDVKIWAKRSCSGGGGGGDGDEAFIDVTREHSIVYRIFFRIMKKCMKCMCDIHLLFVLFEFRSLIFAPLTKMDVKNVKQLWTPLWRDLCQSVDRKLPGLYDYEWKYLVW